MNGSIGARLRLVFFDDPKVLRAMDAATAKVLSKFGANVRRTSRASIKEAKGPAPSGQPPHSHMAAWRRKANKKRKAQGKEPIRGGFTGLKFILFAYDRQAQSVVIGPASNRTRSVTIPEILEYGCDPSRKVSARPFMTPAFEQEKSKLPALWAGSVK